MMKDKSWEKYLNNIRTREIEIVFGDYEKKQFDKGLELGAGNGFQSTMIISYCKRLVSTEYNESRLQKREIENVEYKICDAEIIDSYFSAESFDLVFSSNMFEHLPNPKAALTGIKKIIRHDGLVILIMPSTFWKWCHILLFYPVTLTNVVRRKLFKRARTPQKADEKSPEPDKSKGNNLKLERSKRSFFSRLIKWPEPHGVASTHFGEYIKFKKSTWIRLFKESGFILEKTKRGPITSGYGLHFDRLRGLLWKIGLTSEYIYYLRRPE